MSNPTFCNWLPTAGGGKVDIAVAPWTRGHVDSWVHDVQPHVKGVGSGWDWHNIWRNQIVWNGLRQQLRGFAITLAAAPTVVCALILVARRYKAIGPSPPGPFLWYLRDAPVPAISALAGPDLVPKKLGSACLDTALVDSVAAGADGRLALHADPDGGSQLANWYTRKGMVRVPPTTTRTPLWRWVRPNDGRYFYYDAAGAARALRSMDQHR